MRLLTPLVVYVLAPFAKIAGCFTGLDRYTPGLQAYLGVAKKF